MKNHLFFILMFLIVVLSPYIMSTNAQSGGNFAITQSVVANGGGTSTDTVNNLYKIDGTSGEAAAGGSLTGLPYIVKSGFWNSLLPPTAAHFAIGGRVLREDGLGIGNVRVTIIGGTMTMPRIALTSSFGYFRFDEIETGQIYVISISSKRYGFPNPSQTILVFDNVTDIVFQAGWQNWIKPIGIGDGEMLNLN